MSGEQPKKPKKPYTTPKLTRHGTIESMTRGGTRSNSESKGKGKASRFP
jgi:hypothetical protein